MFAVWRLVTRSGGTPGSRGAMVLRSCAALVAGASVGAALVTLGALHHLYFDRRNLPGLGPFIRFEFPTTGHLYDTNGLPLSELAREYRHITQYEDIPPIVRDAILATEDKHFFSHNGVDYFSRERVCVDVRVGRAMALSSLIAGALPARASR